MLLCAHTAWSCAGSFEEFLRVLPHVEVRLNNKGAAEFRVLKPDPGARPCTLTLRVKDRTDLWRVLFKAPDARIEIPQLEFEVGQANKRHIDSVYNHISNAVWNLSSHIRGRTDLSAEYVASITQTIEGLTELLDGESPFDFVIHDPTGFSVFKPSVGVEVSSLCGGEAEPGLHTAVDQLIADAEDAD